MARDRTNPPAPPSSGAPSIISAGVRLLGELSSPGEVQLDGTIEGNLRCRQLTIGEGGSVKGEIVAEQATIRGRVEGELRVKSLRLAASAEVIGDIYQESIAIEAGAKISGRIVLGLERAETAHGPAVADVAAAAERPQPPSDTRQRQPRRLPA